MKAQKNGWSFAEGMISILVRYQIAVALRFKIIKSFFFLSRAAGYPCSALTGLFFWHFALFPYTAAQWWGVRVSFGFFSKSHYYAYFFSSHLFYSFGFKPGHYNFWTEQGQVRILFNSYLHNNMPDLEPSTAS